MSSFLVDLSFSFLPFFSVEGFFLPLVFIAVSTALSSSSAVEFSLSRKYCAKSELDRWIRSLVDFSSFPLPRDVLFLVVVLVVSASVDIVVSGSEIIHVFDLRARVRRVFRLLVVISSGEVLRLVAVAADDFFVLVLLVPADDFLSRRCLDRSLPDVSSRLLDFLVRLFLSRLLLLLLFLVVFRSKKDSPDLDRPGVLRRRNVPNSIDVKESAKRLALGAAKVLFCPNPSPRRRRRSSFSSKYNDINVCFFFFLLLLLSLE